MRSHPIRWPARPIRTSAALLKLGYRCNDRCRFCHSSPHRGVDLTTRQALTRIRRVAQAGLERVVFSGGEPTIRRDIVRLTAAARDAGLVPGLVTNGRVLAYEGLREQLLDAGLGQVYLSLHGPSASIHDHLVRAEAFEHSLAALRALSRVSGLSLLVNCVITRPNLPHLGELIELVTSLGTGPRLLKLSFVEPEGDVLDDFDGLVPPLAEAAAQVLDLVSRQRAQAAEAGLQLAVDGFPPCLVPGAPYSDLWTEGFAFLVEAFEGHLHPIDDLNKRRGEPCRRCTLDGCPGVYRTYLERRGDTELRPVTAPRGSSVDFVELGEVPRFDPRHCPCRAGRVPHPDPRREILVRTRGRTVLHRAESGDFTEGELHRIKNQWRQLYLEDPAARGPTDFRDTLRKLQPAAACQRCAHLAACGACWVPSRRDVLAAGERRLTATLAKLRGRILDVGCGAARYWPSPGRPDRAADLELHGLDPDPAAAADLAASDPRFCFHVGEIEDFQPDPASLPYDAVVALRSYSHFRDVDAAAQNVARLLAPGASFLIAGDTPVGLARGAEAVQAAHSDRRLGLDHYHNHGPAEAWSLLQRHPFKLVRQSDPDPGASNLWWLYLERR